MNSPFSEPSHPQEQSNTHHRWNFPIFIMIGLATTAMVTMLVIGTTLYSVEHDGILPYSVRIVAPYLSSLPFVRNIIAQHHFVLKGEPNDRINMLILGMGGAEHDGPYLTDTNLIASFRPSTHTLALLSIPRDLVVPTGQSYWKKINTINATGEATNPGLGGEIARTTFQKLFGIDIPYYARIDFSGFTDIVNALGGITVHVDKSFDDYRYPIIGKEDAEPYDARFTHIHFDAGDQWMDGDRTLTFVRSRHGTNGEGSDFARARRQQRVLEAMREKISSSAFLLNPRQTIRLLELLQQHIKTNLQLDELARMKELIDTGERVTVVTKVLDPQTGLVKESTGMDGAYILIPKDQSLSEIRTLAASIFAEPIATPPASIPTVAIQNATFIAGLARETANDVQTLGYRVTMIGNAQRRLTAFQQNTVYDFTNGQKRADLERLASHLRARVLPQSALTDVSDNAGRHLFGSIAYASDHATFDFLIVIGAPPDFSDSGATHP